MEVTLATAFGCPYDGPVPTGVVLAAAERALAAGVSAVSLADTIGTAIPKEVADLVTATIALAGDRPVGVHLHDTRGLGVANALTAIDAGAARVDGSVGALGGCPFAPGASGNMALEDLVHVLEESGVDTGIDLDALVEAATLACELVGRPVESHVGKAGARFRNRPVVTSDRRASDHGTRFRRHHARLRAGARGHRREPLPPGQRLIEQRLAAELGLSRTPVREALRILEAEGLVVSERNRGATVRPLSPTEVVDLYGLRIRLESYAAELAAARITDQELGALADAADEFGAVRNQVDIATIEGVRRLNEANRRFHDRILAAARHDRLATMLARTVDIPLVFQAFRSFGPAEIERSDTFHHLIVDAIARRDGSRAAALMAEHIAQGRDAVLDAMAVAGDPPA